MSKLDDAFATLRNLITDHTRDIAMAMAELRSVAVDRDKLRAERDKAVMSLKDAGFTLADGAERWKPPVNERMGELYQRLFILTDERDRLKAERDRLKKAHGIAIFAWDTARQSLRAAEQDVAETESVNSDLRTVNARLVADLAAATQRADTAEAILRAKAQPYYIQATGTLIGTTTDAQ